MLRRTSLALAFASFVLAAACSAAEATTSGLAAMPPADQVAEIIRNQQLKRVKKSTGIEAYQCFTDVDLQVFLATGVPAKAAAQVRASRDFDVVLTSLRTLSSDSLGKVLAASRGIGRPTWMMMGRIDPAGNGQTDAGRTADLKIAEAVTDMFAAALR